MPRRAAPRTTLHRPARWAIALLAAVAVVPSTGCLGMLMATGVYMFQGGNFAPAECELLNDRRVVVFCRPPASHEFRQAGASRQIASRVSELLEMNVPGIDVVPQKQVDQWIDENDSDEHQELGRAVNADLVLRIELGHFELYNGKTMYQGNADVRVSVHDVADRGRRVWDMEMGEVLFPTHSSIAIQDKSVRQFQNEYIGILSGRVAQLFHEHDPHGDFAIDALANR